MILESDVALFLVHHITIDGTASFLYKDKVLGITLEKYTTVKRCGKTGRSILYYFIDGDEREFLTLESLVDAYNEKFKHIDETPHEEVKYFRVTIKKDLKSN